MKRIIALIPVFMVGMAIAQVPSSCIAPPELSEAYHKDIVQLATNYLYQWQSPDTALVHPPQSVLDDITGGMAAILNATSIPEGDSIFNKYCVHNLTGWPSDYAGFLVKLDTSVLWTHAWRNLITVTGNSYVDSLTSQYALHIDNFYTWSIGCYAELGVDSAWNIMALMDSLRYAPGVLSVEPNSMIGGAGFIEYEKASSDRYYSFYFEFNDCFDGCDNYRRWGFRVDSACTVYYLGFSDWGAFGVQPLPPPINCNLYNALPEISEASLQVYPNPALNELTIKVESSSGREKIKIYNLIGEEIFSISVKMISLNGEVKIDVSNLKEGIYFLEIFSGNKIFKGRFVKQGN